MSKFWAKTRGNLLKKCFIKDFPNIENLRELPGGSLIDILCYIDSFSFIVELRNKSSTLKDIRYFISAKFSVILASLRIGSAA